MRKRSSEQGDKKWQQNEQEHRFEQWWDFFLEEDEVDGCWNKWKDPRGTHKTSRRAQGWAHPVGLWPTFIFGTFFIARIIQKTDK